MQKCLLGEDICSQKWDWIKLKIIQLINSTFIIIILLILIIHNLLSKLHLIHFISIFIGFYNYSHSIYFHDHGAYNIIAFLIVIILISLLLLVLQIIFLIFQNKYIYKIISFVFLFLFYSLPKNPANCLDWSKGLNNTYIENDLNKYGCRIKFPKFCSYKIIGFTQDLSKISQKTCSNKKKNSKEKILRISNSPYINKNTIKFGFPLTNNEEGGKDGIDDSVLRTYTYKNLIDMNKNFSTKFAQPEYIVDFSKDPSGELIIKLNFNKTLSLERKKLENETIPYSDNIMIIYIDSFSRANSIRKLEKTLKFYGQFISYKGGYNKKYPNENFHSFQFFKYHSFKGATFQNFPKLFYGNLNNASNFVRINKYYKINGYITGFAIDDCNKDNTRTHHNLTEKEIYDHQLIICDPNSEGILIPKIRCLYKNISSYYLLKYIEQFWREYKYNRKFALVVINDAHEGTLEVIKYTDDIIYNFLNSLYEDNLFKDSSVLLLSDHGTGMPSIYSLNDFFYIERALPMFYIIINDRKNLDYNQQYFNIYVNQQTLITAFDIYNTLGNIVYGNNYSKILNKTDDKDTAKSPFGKSLFEKINQKERNPKKYHNMRKDVCI